MITKTKYLKIEYNLILRLFLDHDNIIESKMKPIMKLNS